MAALEELFEEVKGDHELLLPDDNEHNVFCCGMKNDSSNREREEYPGSRLLIQQEQ